LRAENINLRVSRSQKALIDRAATALGRNRSDFMLETACREAESVLLDRRYFNLPEDEFRRFTAMLDKPRPTIPGWHVCLGRRRRGTNKRRQGRIFCS
jgi:uncharacterized protein (DUF1778 family)